MRKHWASGLVSDFTIIQILNNTLTEKKNEYQDKQLAEYNNTYAFKT